MHLPKPCRFRALLCRLGLHTASDRFPGGHSSSTGFSIEVNVGGREKRYETRGFQADDHTRESGLVALAFVLAMPCTAALWPLARVPILSIRFSLGLILLWMASSILIMLVLATTAFTLQDPRWRQWHGCEHKTIGLLLLDREPTITEMERVAKTVIECGTSSIALVAVASASFALFIWGYYWMGWSLVGMLLGCAAVVLLPYATAWQRWVLVPALVVGLPPLLFALAVERMLAVREPSRKQMEAALQLIRRIRRYNPARGKAR